MQRKFSQFSILQLVLAITFLNVYYTTTTYAQWAQWGGPNRNFTVAPVQLAKTWPEEGPKRLWQRTLGKGYSAISVDDGMLYTMYRDVDNEVVVALDAQTGEIFWESSYPAPSWPGFSKGYGLGPHSTPLIVDDYVYTTGVRAQLVCLNKKTGDRVWAHDLWAEFNAKPSGRGYASSPLAYKHMLLLPVGGKQGHGIMAFDLRDGQVIWKSQNFPPTFSSPIIINVDAQDQLVVFEGTEIVGLEPNTGELLWRHTHRTQHNINASTPVWGDDNLLFVSSGYDSGSRVLRLSQQDGKTTVEELWFSTRMKIQHGTAIRIGKMVYGSSDHSGPTFLMGANVETGEMTAKQRGFAKANVVAVGNDLIVLDEDGTLGLVTPGADGFEVHAQAQILSSRSWTVPTLVGTTLYVRNQKEIMALSLAPNN
jgi:outer membrane protein assembly factor BamB